MSEIARMWATVGADTSSFKREMDDVNGRVNGFKSTIGAMQTVVVGAFAAMAVAAVGMGVGIAKTGIDFLAMREQADIAFTTMLGSGEAAQAMLDKLQAFAAKTPFEFPDLVRASQRLMAMGFQATEVIPTLTAIGDAVAALGGTAETVNRVTTALGQMQAKGKTSAEEMMQLTEAGIPAWQMLADKIGVSIPEAMKMVTKGSVDAKTAISAVVDGIDARFGGMMEKQSTTFNGLLSNLRDVFSQLSGSVMAPFFDKMKGWLAWLVAQTSSPAFTAGFEKFRQIVASLVDWIDHYLIGGFYKLGALIAENSGHINTFVEAAKAIIKPITDTIGKFVTWKDVLTALAAITMPMVWGAITAIVGFLYPIIQTIVLVTAAVAALRWAWQNDFMQIRTITQNTLDKLTRWFIEDSGIWKGTFEKTLEYLEWWANGGWKMKIFFPIRSWLLSIRNEIALWAVIAKNTLTRWVTETERTINGWIDQAVIDFSTWTSDLIREIAHWSSVTGDKIKLWVTLRKQNIEDFVNLWVDKITRWKDDMIEKFQWVFDWWDKHVTPMLNYGREIVQNLWDGAVEVWKRFMDWWGDQWDKLTGTVKVKLEMHSPSKVMKELGGNTVEGFAIGARQALPMVSAAMSGLANMSMGAGNYAYAGAGGGGGNEQLSMAEVVNELRLLRAELRAKNMSVTVQGGGGGAGYSDAVAFRSGLR